MAAGVSLEYEVGEEDAQERIRLDARSWRELTDSVPIGEDEVQQLHREHLNEKGGLLGCLVCGHPELYRQKDFPRVAGFAVVIVAALLAPFTYYISLGAAAVADFFLYHCAGNMTVCYVCKARHRGFGAEPRHPRFDREIEERLRYGEKAVMGKPMRPGGTADAPEPEH